VRANGKWGRGRELRTEEARVLPLPLEPLLTAAAGRRPYTGTKKKNRAAGPGRELGAPLHHAENENENGVFGNPRSQQPAASSQAGACASFGFRPAAWRRRRVSREGLAHFGKRDRPRSWQAATRVPVRGSEHGRCVSQPPCSHAMPS
jgi:hypothetical protein